MCAYHQQLKSWIGMPYPRVLNKPLQRNTCLDNSDVLKEVVLKEDVPAAVRVLLSLIYKKVPVLDAWKDNVCTIRWAMSGREFLIVNERKLEELKTLRNLYKYVRDWLQLEKHQSLCLTFCGCRCWGRQWNEHPVACDDSVCKRYLTGAILKSVVHT